jgi:hypothetical protein
VVSAPLTLVALCVGCFSVSRPAVLSLRMLLLVLLSAVSAAVVGLAFAVVSHVERGEWYSAYSLPAFAVLMTWSVVLLARHSTIAVAVIVGGCAVALALGEMDTALPVLGALGVALVIAAIVGGRMSPRGTATVVVGLCAFDLISFRVGLLERIVFAGASDVPLHSMASVTVGDWTLGSGDLLAAALVGIASRGLASGTVRVILGVIVLPLGLAMTFYVAQSHDTPIPATLPMAIVAAGLLIASAVRERRSTGI